MGVFSFYKKEEKEKEEQFRQRMDEMLGKLMDENTKGQERLEKLSGEILQNRADIRKHDMALEDCLDALAEQQESETQSQKRIRELEDAQEKLLRVVESYQEQMWDMRRYAAKNDPAWLSQLELSESAVKGKMISGGITLIDETGVEVDYRYHEVIEVRDTAEALKARTVAEIFYPGYAYKGMVKKKAKVAAYRNIEGSNGI